MNILVLCTGNSARSILLESILNHQGAGRVAAWSAGSHPVGQVHPQALALLAGHGLPVARLRSKSWDEFAAPGAPVFDLAVTVCGNAATETCPRWPGAPLRAHWGVEDPAAAAPADQPAAFAAAWQILSARATAFLALGPETMAPADLARALPAIAAVDGASTAPTRG